MVMTRTKLVGYLLLTVIMISGTAITCAQAADGSFFNRKVIEIIVCTKVGGGFDSDARLIAPFLQRELPGSTVIVRNVPGSGHIVGANRVWNAPPNGLTIGIGNVSGLIAAQVRGEQGIRFDLRKLTWIGRLYMNHRFLLAGTKTGFDSVGTLLKSDREFRMGTEGVGSGPYNTGLMMAEALDLKKFRMIPGYGGSDEFYGILRGEIDGTVGSLEFWMAPIERKEVAPLIAFDAKRYRRFPGTPTLSELVKTAKGKAIAAYISTEPELQRTIFAPPNLPKNIAQTLTDALLRAMKNPKLNATVVKMGGRDGWDPLQGKEVAEKVKAALDLSPDMVNLIKQVAKEQ